MSENVLKTKYQNKTENKKTKQLGATRCHYNLKRRG